MMKVVAALRSRLPLIASGLNTRSQSYALINLHTAIGGNINRLLELFTSGILGISAAEHLADYAASDPYGPSLPQRKKSA